MMISDRIFSEIKRVNDIEVKMPWGHGKFCYVRMIEMAQKHHCTQYQ